MDSVTPSWTGLVHAIYIADKGSGPVRSIAEADTIAGRGIRGDRGTDAPRAPDEQLTLVEIEAIEAANRDDGLSLGVGDTRRNVVTRGVALNHLVDRVFTVGEVRARGVELCEPCRHLQDLTGQRVIQALVHRGGLRAEILEGGIIRTGDPIRPAC